jgi:hypothetical protein
MMEIHAPRTLALLAEDASISRSRLAYARTEMRAQAAIFVLKASA